LQAPPDNLKSGVNKASFYDPEINRSYGMMAHHYGVGVLPARPRKPRDKAKVENGVRFAQSYILGRLRGQTFFSLSECNAAMAAMVERINAHPMHRLGTTRRALFEAVERAALLPLPSAAYVFAEWRLALDQRDQLAGQLSRARVGSRLSREAGWPVLAVARHPTPNGAKRNSSIGCHACQRHFAVQIRTEQGEPLGGLGHS